MLEVGKAIDKAKELDPSEIDSNVNYIKNEQTKVLADFVNPYR